MKKYLLGFATAIFLPFFANAAAVVEIQFEGVITSVGGDHGGLDWRTGRQWSAGDTFLSSYVVQLDLGTATSGYIDDYPNATKFTSSSLDMVQSDFVGFGYTDLLAESTDTFFLADQGPSLDTVVIKDSYQYADDMSWAVSTTDFVAIFEDFISEDLLNDGSVVIDDASVLDESFGMFSSGAMNDTFLTATYSVNSFAMVISGVEVPEPGPLGLILIGAFALFFRRLSVAG